jgi:hypothetical protein
MERLSICGEISVNIVTTRWHWPKTFMPRLFGIRGFARAFELHPRYGDLARTLRETGGIGAFKLSGPGVSFHVDPRILHSKSTYLSPGFVESFRLMVRTIGIVIGAQFFRDLGQIGPLGIFPIRTLHLLMN